MTLTQSSAPTLEQFNLDSSVYETFNSEKQKLKEIEEKNDKQIEKIENNWFFGLLFVIFFYGGICLIINFFIRKLYLYGVFISVLYLLFLYLLENKSNLICSLITFGRYKKLVVEKEKTEQQIKKLEETAKDKVKNFEDAFYSYYKDQLDSFYSNRLYKKRSGTKEFEDSLGEFDSMIQTISDVNKILLTKSFYLWEYKDYLEKRKIEHNIQSQTIENKKFVHVNNFVKKILQSNNKKEIVPPEIKFRNPVKIDWEQISKNNIEIGLKGEEITISNEKIYLIDIGREDLANEIRHVSVEEGDGLGYDILSFFPDGRKKFIEVKTTRKSIDTSFYISRNELNFLKENQDNYFICRLSIDEERKTAQYEINSASDILNNKEFIPIEYVVKNKL